MKRHKAPGLSGLVAEIIQATGDTGTQWILDLCNGILKEESIPEDWKSSVVLPIYKGKGDPIECGSYRGIKLLEHAMKVVERIFEHRIRQQIEIDDMHACVCCLLHYFSIHLRIDLIHFEAGCCKRRLNLALVFVLWNISFNW